MQKGKLVFLVSFAITYVIVVVLTFMFSSEYLETYGQGSAFGSGILPALIVGGISWAIYKLSKKVKREK